jgi:soluble P-type ATPase
MNTPCLELEMPGGAVKTYTDLVLDFSGTLSLDGVLLPGVADRLTRIASTLRITVLTADTFGKAAGQLKDLPVQVEIIATGADKANALEKIRSGTVIAIGNGRNDVPMMERAGLSIAVIGPEGAACQLLWAADIVVRDILEALDLAAHPLRLIATLRD